MYYSEINRPPRKLSKEGGFKKTIDRYEELVDDKTAKLFLKKVADEPFYEKMQEETEGQLLETLITRYKVDINNKKITQLQEALVDLTTMPEDLLETYALGHKLEQQFNNTSAEIKDYFGDFAGYLKSFQSGNLASDLDKISKLHAKTAPVAEPQATTQPTAEPQATTQNQFLGGLKDGQ